MQGITAELRGFILFLGVSSFFPSRNQQVQFLNVPSLIVCISLSSGAVRVTGLRYCMSFLLALEGDKAIIQLIFFET